ncbi:MAG: type I methionyl aminopeptidase [Chitinispirillales bacterium]|jgi:methionyl aminopeptidase|nr:type I methionyl aminopeptidase [Chitinispirillales bacterium]
MTERNSPCWCGSGKKYKKCHLAIDESERRSGGGAGPAASPKPKKNHAKTSAQIAEMRRSGEFNGRLMDYMRPFVKSGVVTDELNKLVHEYTIKHGHKPACLGYKGFKKSCCISKNDVVCHGIPSQKERIADGDIVNLDMTTIVGGYHSDSSETFLIGEVSKEARHLAEVAARALIIGIDSIKPWAPLRTIGEAVEPFVNAQGCSVVKQYTGHGIGTRFHEFFSVYHHVENNSESDIIMCPGMTFTVEPMINLGGWEVTTDKKDKWTVRTKDGSLSAQYEHTILVTESGAEVLTLTPSQKSAGVRLHACGKDYR